MKIQISLYLLLLSFSFCLLSCDTTDPPPDNGNGNGDDKPKPKLTLSVDDTSPTEVWLNVTTENIPLPDTLKLLRNNVTVQTIQLYDSSYTIYEDSPLPSQSYSYRAVINDTVTSEATAVTMDTTSHNFTWEVFEFGEHSNSILRDVAIIDENNIWAVGEIYLKDSTGANDSKLYNAVHWNGSQWEISRITVNYNDRFITPVMYGIYAFSEDEIWTTSGIPTRWNGEEWVQYHLFDMGILSQNDGILTKIWGSSSNDLYFVGSLGTITHYNGTSWSKIESGTEVDLRDVWGDGSKVFITGMDDSNGNTVLLSLNNSTLQTLYDYNVLSPNQGDLEGFVRGVWFNEFPYFYLLTSSHVTRIRKDNMEEQKRIYEVSPGFTGGYHHIRGSGINDLMIVGNRNHIAHYNGRSWREYTEIFDNDVLLTSLSIREDMVVISGLRYVDLLTRKGIIIIGRR